MKTLYQPDVSVLNVQYQPDAKTSIIENPPRFTWMPAQLEDDCYVLQISQFEDFASDDTLTFKPIPYNFFTPSQALQPGTYYWRYALVDQEANVRSEWSAIRTFLVSEGLPETPMPRREERYSKSTLPHPRLWLNQEELDAFKKQVAQDPSYCNWSEFLERSVLPWLERDLIAEPARYPDNKRVIKLWRQMYMDCQETLYAIRHLSVAAIVLENESILEKAKRWLLHAASWDTEGTTSRDYNDEAAFRIAGALAWGYDWLYSALSEEERQIVRQALFRRTEQVAFHVIERSKIHHVPYDSHAVRSLSSVLVPCCIALFDEVPEAREWLDYTLEYYSCLYSPWGGADGGWAEGPMYWTTGMAYLTEGLNLVRKFTGVDIYQRPFFAKTGDFPLYCYSPDTIRASFGDQSSLGDRPGLKTAFNIRQFAGITGNGRYQWYFDQVKEYDVHADEKFYNYGWWDFRFDDMMYLHDYPEVKSKSPSDIEPVKWFKDVGWVAFHHKMDQPDDHIMLLTKSSSYGSVSHSHGDQNSFLLHAFGEPLVIKTGYYIGFNSTMHMNWRRQTHSHNTLLIDGKGQYAGTDKTLNMSATGKIIRVESTDRYHYVQEDATQAYKHTVPYLNLYQREIYFIDQSYFVIVDAVDLDQPGRVDWLLHSLTEMKLHGQAFHIEGQKADLEGRFIYSSSGDLLLSQDDEFIGVDPAEVEGLPKQWHLTASTRVAAGHRIVTLLVPKRKQENKYVSYFMDDQDHGVNIYLTENGKTQRIEVAKAY
ncbi:DUF4962 domain-containing protein [Ammoniphilus sp. YIM 78166]|uniref:DUF4962 domain-containing protein n=1 Tax=Ammoniphilus sp. YIM 78166 TaxID=1644106 RepID=UPI00106F6DD2|nr:DUF4962 domain-containing protein [Ammoniphilus sp. YIM 78166]